MIFKCQKKSYLDDKKEKYYFCFMDKINFMKNTNSLIIAISNLPKVLMRHNTISYGLGSEVEKRMDCRS